MKAVKITDTTLRDAHQSLWATRMRTEDMLPILRDLDDAGYYSLEVWGGATFDVCLRFLGEDPWERLRQLKSHVVKTPLQMLLRAQSLVGYQHYPDDIVEEFISLSVKNGIDIIRIFDALNDVRNMVVPLKAAKQAGAHVQAAVVYTISPVHTIRHYLETAAAFVELGADSVCIKDMAGLLTPYRAYELVSLLKKELGVMVQLHSHYIGGIAVPAYLKSVEAGADVVDTASVPLAFGASQPPVETVVRALQDTGYDTGLDMRHLFHIAKYFEDLRKSRGFERGITRISDMRVFEHQVPGGMISNFVNQLEEQGALDKIHDVLEEVPKVRAELGYPPLVTPTSQIVGSQAVLNVLSGVRYKLIPDEVRGYVRGLYGNPPAPINPEIQKRIIGNEEPVTARPADSLEPGLAKAQRESLGLARSPEDVMSYALFPQIAKKFFEGRQSGQIPREEMKEPKKTPEKKEPPKSQKTQETRTTLLSKEDSELNLQEVKELIKVINETEISELNLESDGVKVIIRKGSGTGTTSAASPRRETEERLVAYSAVDASLKVEAAAKTLDPSLLENAEVITSPMVGTFYSSQNPEAPPYVQIGQHVKMGQPVCIVEAMKLMNVIESEVEGKIAQILVENAQPVEYGQPLFVVEKL